MFGRGAGRAVLHVRQLVSDRRRARLHRQELRLAGADHVAVPPRGGVRRTGTVSRRHPDARRRRPWRSRRRPDPRLCHRGVRTPRHPDPRRGARWGDALLVGHDRPAQGDHPTVGRGAAVVHGAAVRVPVEPVAVPRRHDLPVAGTLVPLRSAGGGEPHDPPGRHRRDHGALRPRRVPPADRASLGHAHAARSHHVQPDVEAARGRPPPRRPVIARVRGACRCAVSRAGEGADDRLVGADHPRVLRRDRGFGVHGVQQRGVARPPRDGRQGDPRRPAHPRRRHEPAPARGARHDLVQDGHRVRVPQRSRQDGRGDARPTAR